MKTYKPKKLAVSMKGYIGDTVMATPLLDGLLGQGACVEITAPPIVLDVLGEGWSSRFHSLGRRRGLQALRTQVRIFRNIAPESVVLVNRSFRSALAAWLARVPQRVGHSTEGRKLLLTKSLDYDPVKSEIACYSELASLIGYDLALDGIPKLELLPAELEAGRKELEPLGARLYAIQPGARHEDKKIPNDVVVETIVRLRGAGFEPVLVGGPEEVPSAGQVIAQLERPCADLTGKLPLRMVIGLLASAPFVIGADTGLMHLSVAVGTPTVTVFGPNPASKWGHFNPPHVVIEAKDGNMANLDAETIVEAALQAVGAGDLSPEARIFSAK